MSARWLEVACNGERVGLIREEEGLWAFEYDPDWQGFDLSPALSRGAFAALLARSKRPTRR